MRQPCIVGDIDWTIQGDVNTLDYNNGEDTSTDLNLTYIVDGRVVITVVTPVEVFFLYPTVSDGRLGVATFQRQ